MSILFYNETKACMSTLAKIDYSTTNTKLDDSLKYVLPIVNYDRDVEDFILLVMIQPYMKSINED